MKTFRLKCELSIGIAITGLLHVVAGGVSEFRRCYNTSEDTHCFGVQYDTTNNQSLTLSFDDARKLCNDQNADLLIIKNEETDEIFQKFINDADNPIRLMSVWTDAYRFDDFNQSYRWRWLNSALPNFSASDVEGSDPIWYVASVAFNGKRFYLRAQQPHFQNSYICEYESSSCSAINSSSARHFDGRCYDAINDTISWYDARNRCLKGGGDLASFANVSSINFSSWLSADSDIRYWIGLRFGGYIWKDSGDDAKFVKWVLNGDWTSTCLIVCNSGPNCHPNFSWFPQACNITNSVVCHSAATLRLATTATTITPSAMTTCTSRSEAPQSIKSTPPYESTDSASSKRLAIGVGVGVGLGVAVLIAVIVIVICVVLRKRRREPSIAQPVESPNVNERREVGDNYTTYGIVVP